MTILICFLFFQFQLRKRIGFYKLSFCFFYFNLFPHIPTLIPRIPTLIPIMSTLIPRIPIIPTLIPRTPIIPTLIPRIPFIPFMPSPDSPFWLLHIALFLRTISLGVSLNCDKFQLISAETEK